ncbi:MAG: M3 family oligoendopeptidase [Chitinophagaceae bacterium]|nr:M3 family oligoendopeptidase [Chitinophagaceae bacterium]
MDTIDRPASQLYTANIQKITRHFLPADLTIDKWETLEPWFKELLERKINSKTELEKWLMDMSELEAVINEDVCWRQIRMTCDTENKVLEDAFNFFCLQIQPHIQPYADALNKKLIASPFTKELDHAKYFTYLRSVKKNIDLFREENIPLQAELSVMQQQYGMISGKMTIEVNGDEYTLQQASKFLENPDRELREEVYRKMNERRLQDKDALNDLYTQLIQKRNQESINAGFENYRDFKFKELGRFDYTKEDCFQFHESVKQHVVPLVNKIYEKKKAKLKVAALRPWDVEAEPVGIKPLTPFTNGSELLQKSIDCFTRLRPFFGECLEQMDKMKHLDLESRKGKAPGGYNCPLAESGAPFIFMNAAGQMHDVTTMLHEGGHAVQSFLTHSLELNAFKEYPMEIAEVASMAMELFTMDYWDVFFDNKDDLKRAKEHQLERTITLFPWIAVIDKFQHWIYENPVHSVEERTQAWLDILNTFSDGVIDYSGLEKYREISWQKQLHLFEVPFYYIEYGIAQLGAIGMWMQFKKNPEKALDNYMYALSLGGTKTLPQLYEAAGLKFDFSPGNIKMLMDFVQEQLEEPG